MNTRLSSVITDQPAVRSGKVYRKPELTVYGQIQDITRSILGNMANTDGSPTRPKSTSV